MLSIYLAGLMIWLVYGIMLKAMAVVVRECRFPAGATG